jgi:hypothetical protein
MNPEEFVIELNRKIAELVYEEFNKKRSFEVASVINNISDLEVRDYLQKLSIDKYSISSEWEKLYPGKDNFTILSRLVKDSMKKFKSLQIENQITDILLQVEEASSNEEQAELLPILNQYYLDKLRLKEEFN